MVKALKPKLQEIKLDLIDEPTGVIRLEIEPEALKDLADNIQAVGLLQPILVRPVNGRFEIIHGHRRYLAHKLLEKTRIACIVRKIDDLHSALARASENSGRVDLSPIEEAAVYANLCDNYGLTIDQVGEHMGKKPGIVRRRLDLLKMPPQLQKAIHLKQIGYSVAEELWSLGDNSAIDYYLAFAVDHGATQIVVRGWVKDWKDAKRHEESGTEERGGVTSPAEPRPVYVSCDLCRGPMEIGTETTFRTCPDCTKFISNAVTGGG